MRFFLNLSLMLLGGHHFFKSEKGITLRLFNILYFMSETYPEKSLIVSTVKGVKISLTLK